MTPTGIIRNVDQLGRIVLPSRLREKLNLREGTPLEVWEGDGEIILKIYKPTCRECGKIANEDQLHGEARICGDCVTKLYSMIS